MWNALNFIVSKWEKINVTLSNKCIIIDWSTYCQGAFGAPHQGEAPTALFLCGNTLSKHVAGGFTSIKINSYFDRVLPVQSTLNDNCNLFYIILFYRVNHQDKDKA